ncbi:hypothetical protein BKA93DRAFT_747037 [Sparassis latifolia]
MQRVRADNTAQQCKTCLEKSSLERPDDAIPLARIEVNKSEWRCTLEQFHFLKRVLKTLRRNAVHVTEAQCRAAMREGRPNALEPAEQDSCLRHYPEPRTEPYHLEFKAKSPDEAALVAAARDVGFPFVQKSRDGINIEASVLHDLFAPMSRKRGKDLGIGEEEGRGAWRPEGRRAGKQIGSGASQNYVQTKMNEEIDKSAAGFRHCDDFRHLASDQFLQLELAPLLNRIISPPLRPVNGQVIRPHEWAILSRLIDIMVALELRFMQENAEDRQLVYRLDPPIDVFVFVTYDGERATDISVLHYAFRHLVVAEVRRLMHSSPRDNWT